MKLVLVCLFAGQIAAPSLAAPPQPPFKPFDIVPIDYQPEPEPEDADDE